MEKEQRVKATFELIHAQTRCARTLCAKLAGWDDPAYKQLLELVVRMLDQFTFEIRSEMYKNGEMDFNGFLFKEVGAESELIAIQAALDCYENALNTTVRERTRAMLSRQHFDLQKAYERLVGFHRLVSTALDAANHITPTL
jgi:hypothetical protein